MVEFNKFKAVFQENFRRMTAEANHLFEVEVDKDILWSLYLESFPEGTNPMYRTRREFDCSCCRHFIKAIGNAVVIKDNIVTTMWDFNTGDTTFQPVVNALSAYIHSLPVTEIYFSKFAKVGTNKNFEDDGGNIVEWEHFYLKLPAKFVNNTGKSEGDLKGQYRDLRNVFKRSLDEITEDSLLIVLELIAQNSLYKGEEWQGALTTFLNLKKKYDKLPANEKENFAWEQSVTVGGAVGKLRGHSIGTLLLDIVNDVDLDVALRKYEAIVAPSNYKRPKAVFTKKMLEDAQKTLEDLGYMSSLSRRFATLSDITVNNILFSNRDSAKRIAGASVFDELKAEVGLDPKHFAKVEEVTIQDFVNNILPTTREISLLLENKHSGNMMSLIAPEVKDSKCMFKWDNGFSWAYSGNITDSMKERVKAAGGRVDGVLRFSIQWNDGEYSGNDLDAHAIEPNRNEIYFGHNRGTPSSLSGILDVDITYPMENVPAVENITWSNRSRMMDGVYSFYVYQYHNCGGKDGFRAEIEFDGQIYSFDYNKEVRQGEKIQVAEVVYSAKDGFSIREKLPSTSSVKEMWGLKSNQFVPVSVVMFSPNYWDGQQGIGNRHYFFMLKDCVNPENPNGFYNEFLKEDLLKHKHVFEALGGKMAVKDVEDQLSGLGFSSTQRSEVVVKVTGVTERVIKIKF